MDVVTAASFGKGELTDVMRLSAIPDDGMILDVGPDTIRRFSDCLFNSKAVLWNGPLGAFENSPYDASTVMLARVVASLTRAGKLKSIAGGGDTVAALTHARVAERFSYLSTGWRRVPRMDGRQDPAGCCRPAKAAEGCLMDISQSFVFFPSFPEFCANKIIGESSLHNGSPYSLLSQTRAMTNFDYF